MPLRAAFWIAIRVKDGLVVLVREMAWPVEFWIAPPVQLAVEVQEPPLPETVRLPLAPVVFSTIPLLAPFDEMLRKVRPLAPMVVLVTLSAVPVVESIVLGFAPVVTLTIPLLEALKPVPLVVSISSPPLLKLIVEVALLLSVTAVLVLVLKVLVAPLNVKFGLPEVLF